jgi:spore coat polysaccharide biosynthesis predicted glycosyltransferase SpsG
MLHQEDDFKKQKKLPSHYDHSINVNIVKQMGQYFLALKHAELVCGCRYPKQLLMYNKFFYTTYIHSSEYIVHPLIAMQMQDPKACKRAHINPEDTMWQKLKNKL